MSSSSASRGQITVGFIAAVSLLVTSVLVGGFGFVTPARATTSATITEWNFHASNAILNMPAAGVPGAGQPPQVAQLHLAMVQGAVYDAVNSIDGGHEPYLSGLPSASPSASMDAAAAQAAHDVLVGVSPLAGVLPVVPPLTSDVQEDIIDRLDVLLAASLSGITAGQAKDDGIAAGRAAAVAMLTDRLNDGRYVPFSFTEGTGIGEWRPLPVTPPAVGSDPFAWVANVRPFLLESTSQLRTDGPNALTSADYTEEYNEVKELGSNVVPSPRTAEQTALADFYTVSPPELWNRTFRGIAVQEEVTLVEQARLFAMLNMAGADALISCWDDKEHWGFWRPITAIRLGDFDGNPATIGDPTWTSKVGNPPYPEHPSGYNCVTSAFMHTGRDFFGTNKIEFSVDKTPTGPTRDYVRFTDTVKDTIDARVYQGIHFRTADVQGAVIGKQVAHWLDRNYFGSVA